MLADLREFRAILEKAFLPAKKCGMPRVDIRLDLPEPLKRASDPSVFKGVKLTFQVSKDGDEFLDDTVTVDKVSVMPHNVFYQDLLLNFTSFGEHKGALILRTEEFNPPKWRPETISLFGNQFDQTGEFKWDWPT